MPDPVARQRDVLSALLDVVESDPRLRWFELGCSLGRGAGDALSDIDCGVGIASGAWPRDALALADALAAAGGTPIDTMRQVFPGRGGESCWHVFTLYANGTQLSLVLTPAAWATGLRPGSVALYDADGLLATPVRPPAADATPQMLHEWAALAWIALGDLAKYLDRGSLWEALERLHTARGELFKLWAAGSKIDFPGYGLTALLDDRDGESGLPPGVTRTVASLDATDLRRAACATADLLTIAVSRIRPALTSATLDAPDGLRTWVLQRLAG